MLVDELPRQADLYDPPTKVNSQEGRYGYYSGQGIQDTGFYWHESPKLPNEVRNVISAVVRNTLNTTYGGGMELPDWRFGAPIRLQFTGRAATFYLLVEPIVSYVLTVPHTPAPAAIPPNASSVLESSRTSGATQARRPMSNRRQSARRPFTEATPYVEAFEEIKQLTGLSDARVSKLVGISRQTPHLWRHGRSRPSDANEQRLYAVRELLKILRHAASQYQTPEQLKAWLDTPFGSEAKTPAQLIGEGRLDRARLLAVMTPSPSVVAPPSWVNKPVPEKYRAVIERPPLPLPADSLVDTDLDPDE